MMNAAHVLEAKERTTSGTGVARALRRDMMVPAIVYGSQKEPMMLAVDEKQLLKEIHTSGFFNRVLSLHIDGKEHSVLAREVQLHPVTDLPLHVDFQRVDQNSRLHLSVPLLFINEDKSPALKRGATLNIVQHNIQIVCSPTAIPEEFVIDLTTLEMGGNISLDMITLPKDVKFVHPTRDYVIATLVGGSSKEAETEE